MEPNDVACPYETCLAKIGEPCRNPQGGPLGNTGSRQRHGRHNDRWQALSELVSEWEASGQGQLKSLLRYETQMLEAARQLPARTVQERADKDRILRSRQNRYSALWSLLDPPNRPVVGRYVTKEPKKDVPHPELIDCPHPGCDKLKGEKCDTPGGFEYHLLRIRRSP